MKYAGTKETINGQEYYTVTTDSNGEITVDLPEGMYKAVEVESNEKYDLNNNEYYFGIGASREGKLIPKAEWLNAAKGSYYDQGHALAQLNDGSYVIGGFFGSSELDFGKGIKISRKGGDDGYIAKYSPEGEITWAECVGGPLYGDAIRTIANTSDGGFLAGGYFANTLRLNNSHSLSSNGGRDGILLKYSVNGQVEWERKIGGNKDEEIHTVLETSDGGFVVSGYFKSASIDLGNGISISNNGSTDYYDGMLIKFNSLGEAEWAKSIGGANHDYIKGLTETVSGEIVVVGYYFSDSISVSTQVNLYNSGETEYSDAFIIKYDLDGNYIESKNIGNSNSDTIENICATSDGGYAICGTYVDELNLGEITLNKHSNTNGMVIKYLEDGNIDWGKGFGDVSLNEVISKEDNSVIVGGVYKCSKLQIDKDIILTNSRNECGMIIKFDSDGNGKWGKSIGGCQYMNITGLIETKDKEIATIGTFQSGTLYIDGFSSVNNANNTDTMLIKLNENELPTVVTKFGKDIGDGVNSVVATPDGGYIVGGEFFKTITLENGEVFVNNKRITNEIYSDGLIVKYNRAGKIEWAKAVGGDNGPNDDTIKSVAVTTDGGYIVGGNFQSPSIMLDDGITLTNTTTYNQNDVMLIKYDGDGNIMWAKNIGGTGSDSIKTIAATIDGGFIVGGNFASTSITLENGIKLVNNGYSDGMIIKYDCDGNIEWAKIIGGPGDDLINSITVSLDNSYIFGGSFTSNIITLDNVEVLTNTKNNYSDGMIIKLNYDGNLEWSKKIGGTKDDKINSVAVTTEGDYIVGGSFNSTTITLDNGEQLKNGDYSSGMIIKYDKTGTAKWAKNIKGFVYTSINSVVTAPDGGILVGGDFSLNTGVLNLENGESFNNRGLTDWLVMKYDSEGKTEWGKTFGGYHYDYIRSVSITQDGGYLIGGEYTGIMELGNGESIDSNTNGADSHGRNVNKTIFYNGGTKYSRINC